MAINWEQRALQAEQERDTCLHKIKQLLDVVKAIRCQVYIADNLREPDELDKYRYNYP